MTTCWYCSSEVPETSQYCPSCGHSQIDRSSSPLFGVVDTTTGIWNSKFVNALAADKIRRSIASHDFGTTGAWKRITVSCGAATINADYRPKDEAGVMNRREYTGNLLREAQQALESGRSAGTNRTTVGAYRS